MLPPGCWDWTYSRYVALFFAVESAKVGDTCVIWAIGNEFLDTEVKNGVLPKLLPEHRKIFTDAAHDGDKTPEVINAILEAEGDIIVPLNPFRLTERLAIQQGVFLASQSTKESFATIFDKMQSRNPASFRKYEITCSLPFLKDVFELLHRMNISRATLFPGLDGFSRSFENLLVNETLWHFL